MFGKFGPPLNEDTESKQISALEAIRIKYSKQCQDNIQKRYELLLLTEHYSLQEKILIRFIFYPSIGIANLIAKYQKALIPLADGVCLSYHTYLDAQNLRQPSPVVIYYRGQLQEFNKTIQTTLEQNFAEWVKSVIHDLAAAFIPTLNVVSQATAQTKLEAITSAIRNAKIKFRSLLEEQVTMSHTHQMEIAEAEQQATTKNFRY